MSYLCEECNERFQKLTFEERELVWKDFCQHSPEEKIKQLRKQYAERALNPEHWCFWTDTIRNLEMDSCNLDPDNKLDLYGDGYFVTPWHLHVHSEYTDDTWVVHYQNYYRLKYHIGTQLLLNFKTNVLEQYMPYLEWDLNGDMTDEEPKNWTWKMTGRKSSSP